MASHEVAGACKLMDGSDLRIDSLLARIEQRTASMRAQSRQAIAVFFGIEEGHAVIESSEEFFKRAQAEPHLTSDDLERYAAQWEDLIPEDAVLRAHLAWQLSQKYGFARDAVPSIRQALGLDTEPVQRAYETLYNRPIAALYRTPEELNEERLRRLAGESADEALERDLESHLSCVRLAKGQMLMREGDPGDSAYIVVNGRLRVFSRLGSDQERHIADIGRGETVGEMGPLTGDLRNATVYAVRDSILLKLPRTSMEAMAYQYPRLGLSLARLIARRLQVTQTQRPGKHITTIALIALAPIVPVSALAADLVTALSKYGATLHLTTASLAERLRQAGTSVNPDNSEVVGWLNDEEARHHFVLYEAEPEVTTWTRRCLKQADRILLVAPGSSFSECDAALRDLVLSETLVEREMVLVHPAKSNNISGTSFWLQRWPVVRHHHVSLQVVASVERLGRVLAGQAVGLVLSGGGSRCLAQIGVIQALKEAGIPVDFIGGTSGGAILGAEYAAGWDMNAMVTTTVELIVKQNRLLDSTFPFLSIYKGRGIGRALDAMFGRRQIEDLWLPYFCVSSNLTTADAVIHRAGSLRQAVRASLSIPGVVPPVLADGDLLVDGGLLDNVPIGPMRQICEGGSVIAVDVGVQRAFAGNYRFQDVLPAHQLLRSRLNPFAREKLVAPSIVSVILRSVELNSVRGRGGLAQQADLYMTPPVAGFGIFDRRAGELVDIGYRYAVDKIAEWAKLRQPAT